LRKKFLKYKKKSRRYQGKALEIEEEACNASTNRRMNRRFRRHAIDRGNKQKRKNAAYTQIVTDPLALADRLFNLGSVGGYSLEECQHAV